MKKILGVIVLLMISAVASASELGSYGLTPGFFEFTAPVIYNRTALVNSVAGQIVYDGSGTGAFYGLIPSADPTMSGSWLQLGGSATGGTPLLSTVGSTERMGRITSNGCLSGSCTIASQSGSWISTLARTAVGQYTLSVVTGTFSSAPSCTASPTGTDSSTGVASCIVQGTTSSVFVECVQTGVGTVDNDFSVICMGPQ